MLQLDKDNSYLWLFPIYAFLLAGGFALCGALVNASWGIREELCSSLLLTAASRRIAALVIAVIVAVGPWRCQTASSIYTEASPRAEAMRRYFTVAGVAGAIFRIGSTLEIARDLTWDSQANMTAGIRRSSPLRVICSKTDGGASSSCSSPSNATNLLSANS